MKQLIALIPIFVCAFCFTPGYAQGTSLKPDQALQKLLDGNERYVQGQLQGGKQIIQKRKDTVAGQSPFAIVLDCSDSRVIPELIFDQSIGDLFVVRVAGNVAGPIELDSIEYAIDSVNSPLLVVLGHQSCAAVKFVIDEKVKEMDLEHIAVYIRPAVEKSKKMEGDRLVNAVCENVRSVIELLKSRPVISKQIAAGKLRVVGGYYHLDSGKVDLLQ